MAPYLGAFFFQAEDGIRDADVTGVQTCALPILPLEARVERQPTPTDAETRGRLGRQLRKILDAAGSAFNDGGGTPPYDAATYRARYEGRFPIEVPDVSGTTPSAQVLRARAASMPHATRYLKAVAGRSADGAAILEALPDGPLTWAGLPSSLTDGVPSEHRDFVLAALDTFRT